MKTKFILSFLFLVSCALGTEFVYVTYTNDPAETALFRWVSEEEKEMVWLGKKDGPTVHYRSHGDLLDEGYFLHTLEIKNGLERTIYEITLKGKVYSFKTLSKTLDETRFVIGGDALGNANNFAQMNEQVAKFNPDFIVVGGDVAYTKKRVAKPFDWQFARWKRFFNACEEQLEREDGCLVPLVAVVGNHDVRAFRTFEEYEKELFHRFFRFHTLSYQKLGIGRYADLFILDSGHNEWIQGEQTKWLKKSLKMGEESLYKIAIYHVAAYPSVYSYNDSKSKKIRANWSPLFEKYGVQLAFEHHNHAYKRSRPIASGKVSEGGVIYLGDGCWGTSPRTPYSPNKKWYLENTAKKNSVFLITLTQKEGKIHAIDKEGNLFDSVTILPNRS